MPSQGQAQAANGQDPNAQDPKKKKGFFGKVAGLFKDDKSSAPVSKPPDSAAVRASALGWASSKIFAGRPKLCQNVSNCWGWPMSSCPRILLVPVSLLAVCVCAFSVTSWAQASHSEQVQVMPPQLRAIDPPAADATAADLEARADQLRNVKLYLDALDYYRAALAKEPHSAGLLNKIGITQLMMQRYHEAKKSFELAIKGDRKAANAYNNLGVVYYEEKKYGAAVKQYRKAIALDDSSASFYSNLGAALFSKKEFEPAVTAYQKALQLDPDVFERSSHGGVQAQLPSPDDRAHYDYTVATALRQNGFVGTVTGVPAQGDGRGLQGFQERVQR